jgi:hypothetical protein
MPDATYITAVQRTSGGDQINVGTSGLIKVSSGGYITESIQYCSTSSTGDMLVTPYGVSYVPMYAAASSGACYELQMPDAGYVGVTKKIVVVTSSENHVVLYTTKGRIVVGDTTWGAITFNTSGSKGGGAIQLIATSSGTWRPLNEINLTTGMGAPRFIATSGPA